MTLDPEAEKKAALRRFTWCRIEHALLNDERWDLVARMAHAPAHLVEALVVRLEIFASANKPRGSLEGLNIPAIAARWRLANDDILARIYAALEHPEVGWIDQDFIVDFWARNPDAARTDRDRALAAARQQRARDRKKAEKEAGRAARIGGYPPSRVTQRDSVTVTPRSDLINKKEAAEKEKNSRAEAEGDSPGAEVLPSHSGDSGDIEVWLAFEGKRIVVERCQVLPTRAWTDISRWRRELADDIATLATILHDSDLMGLAGGKFSDRVRGEIIRYRQDRRGTPLPFPLAAVKKAREHG